MKLPKINWPKFNRKKKEEKKELGFFPTLIIALLLAGFVRSFFFEPFHIPSSSMKPNLLIGDYIFVSKYSYGYSKYSFPFGANFNYFEGRFWQNSQPSRGDVAVFRLPKNPSINYVKRIIGLPGDEIQMLDGILYVNDQKIKKFNQGIFADDNNGTFPSQITSFSEKLPSGKIINILDQMPNSPQDNTGIYKVPEGHYFMMGDNRDNSQDSRFLSEVGYVPQENLIGKAKIIFFSSQKPIWQFWRWHHSIRFERIFSKIN